MKGNLSWGAVITWHVEAGHDFWWEGAFTWSVYFWLWYDDVMDMDGGWWKHKKVASGRKHHVCTAWMVRMGTPECVEW